MKNLDLQDCLIRSVKYSNLDIKTFKKDVDVITYDNISDDIEQLYQTGQGFLNDEVIYWAYTSATTSKPKRIPITEKSLSVYQKAMSPLFEGLVKEFKNDLFQKDSLLPLVGKYHYQDSPMGIKVGCISGLTINSVYEKFKDFIPYDFSVSEKLDFNKRWQYIYNASNNQDIRCVMAANPAYILEIIKLRSFEKKINVIDANLLWPKLKLIITPTGGNCVPYILKLKELFPNITIWDGGFGGSEGYYATTIFKPEPIGVLNESSYQFEFLEIDKHPNEKNTLDFHDLVENQKYQLIFTGQNGLIRYNTQDIITKLGNLIKFVGRNDKIFSFAGERLSEIQLYLAVEKISKEFNLRVDSFKVGWENSQYKFMLFNHNQFNSISQIGSIQNRLDEILKESNINYLYSREMYKLIKKPKIIFSSFKDTFEKDIVSPSKYKLFRQEKPSILI